jgi:hypothetical protein
MLPDLQLDLKLAQSVQGQVRSPNQEWQDINMHDECKVTEGQEQAQTRM